MPEKFLIYNGSSIHYRVIGAGKTVVFIHGFGEDGSVWNQQVTFLKNKFQLIIPDLPGSGKSELIPGITMESMSDVIKEILTQENLSSCTMIGHSMGGYITMAFAENYSGFLNAFGLFHSSSYPDSEEKKATRRKGIEFIKQHGAFEFLKAITPNLFSPVSTGKMKKEIDTFIESLSYFTPQTLIAYYEAMMRRPDRSMILDKSSVPILFIIGQYDTVIPINDLLKQSHLPCKAFIHILTETGHMGMMEETKKSNLILENFLINT
ncbi:MAG: alpha/beta hydrolase [Bacteroidetes bacterium]|nr:alpha/beta hydrolase [Bacteroidota bacterium]MBS1929498.1 alpha/beta hydrolase [Bacteroidota bacterium]